MILPANGRRYGFPKIYDESCTLHDWLVANGFPQSLISAKLEILSWEVGGWPDNPIE
jgi:hypothetical protein